MNSLPQQIVTCCKKSVKIDPFAHLFKPRFVEEYNLIKVEHDTKNKVYCNYKKCSAFIPPPSIEGKKATCQKCGRQTCTQCKNPFHKGKLQCWFISISTRLGGR